MDADVSNLADKLHTHTHTHRTDTLCSLWAQQMVWVGDGGVNRFGVWVCTAERNIAGYMYVYQVVCMHV